MAFAYALLAACVSYNDSGLAGPGPACPPNQVVVCAGNTGSRSSEAADRERRHCECRRKDMIVF